MADAAPPPAKIAKIAAEAAPTPPATDPLAPALSRAACVEVDKNKDDGLDLLGCAAEGVCGPAAATAKAPKTSIQHGPSRKLSVHNADGDMVQVEIEISTGDDVIDQYIAVQVQQRLDAEASLKEVEASHSEEVKGLKEKIK